LNTTLTNFRRTAGVPFLINFFSILILLSKSGNVRSLVRENLALREQLVIANREKANDQSTTPRPIENYFWKSHCNGLFQTPFAI